MSKKPLSPTQKVLNLWAIILIVWSIYRSKFSFPEWLDEFIAKPLVFILPVYLYIKKIERRDFFSSLWLTTKNIFKDIYLGIFIGLVFVVSALFSNYVKHGGFSFTATIIASTSQKLSAVFFIALATGFTEEILSRGFILKRLYEESRNVYSSAFISSILFFILHIPILFTNVKLTGSLLLLFMITDLILSLANSFIFLERKSLILPILIHAFYNMAIVLYV
jgi:membrane protease YdiL (CAAX protease family)